MTHFWPFALNDSCHSSLSERLFSLNLSGLRARGSFFSRNLITKHNSTEIAGKKLKTYLYPLSFKCKT